MQEISVTVTKVKALILEVETDRGDICRIHFSAPKDVTTDQATVEIAGDNDGHDAFQKVKVDLPFEGVIHFETIALT